MPAPTLLPPPVRHGLERAGGATFGAGFAVAARLRGGKPIHPRGVVTDAVLHRRGGGDWGVPWLDAAATDTGVARLSRSIGLPGPLPDILGLAVRLSGPGRAHDLLLASTGMRPGGRHLLLPRRDALRCAYGSLFPYDAAGRSVVLAAVPEDTPPSSGSVDELADLLADHPARFRLLVATPLGRWTPFGTLTLSRRGGADHPLDAPVDFDPVLNPLPGLAQSAPFARVREPAYALARKGRGDG